jgi:hypothetical protein
VQLCIHRVCGRPIKIGQSKKNIKFHLLILKKCV